MKNEIKSMAIFKPVFSKFPMYKFLKSGRAGGKSVVGGQKIAKVFFEEDGDIVVFRSSYQDIKQSIYQEIMNVIEDSGLYKYLEIRQKPLVVRNKINDNRMYFLGIGGADIHRTKGFKPNKGVLSLIVGEELQQIPAQTNLDEAMATFLRYLTQDGEVLYMFNPDRRASHWCNEFYRLKEHDSEFLCIHTNYKNIAGVLSKPLLREIEVERITNPSNYKHRYLGLTEGLHGAVYYTFDRKKHLVNEAQVKDLIDKVGIHQLIIGGDPAYTVDATCLVPILLFKNGQAIAVNYFYHDPKINSPLSNAQIVKPIQRWLEKDIIERWGLNRQSRIDLVFDTQGGDLLRQLAYVLPRNFVPQTYSQKRIVEMAQFMINAFSKNVLFILDEGGHYNYTTNRFVKGSHPLVTQLEQVVWDETNDDIFDKKVPNDCTDALTYGISFYFKNPANLHFPQLQYFYKPIPKTKEELDE